MGEEGHRRAHVLFGGQGDEGVRLGWALDQDGGGAAAVEGRAYGAGGARAVVADAEQHRLRGGGPGHAATSRQAR
nr:hypothetical protein [Streptomyces luteoverticillatus]